jgi:hypothetical protein
MGEEAIQVGIGTACREVWEEPAAEAVLAGREYSLAAMVRSDDREVLDAP